MEDWFIYRGTGKPHDGIKSLPPPPRWRAFASEEEQAEEPQPDLAGTGWSPTDLTRAAAYRPKETLLSAVNAALYLRRPLLVTGKPGVGKSSLAYSVAFELGLGPVLRWPITSRSSLREGLYQYDAISRLHDVNLKSSGPKNDIGRYLRLGTLGTALLPSDTPRVLLVDEIDKADIDFPNDMLTVFEEGEYEIPELVRIADTSPTVTITTADGTSKVEVCDGKVRCRQFPLVIMTSNGEREFPPAFLRRCLRLDIQPPGFSELAAIVEAQLGPKIATAASSLIKEFHDRAQEGDLATDQLLNAIQLSCHVAIGDHEHGDLLNLVLRSLADEAE